MMKSFEDIFKQYYVRLCAYAYPYVRSEDTVKDIVQDAFFVLFERPDVLEKDEVVIKSFLYSTVKNLCLNHMRREKVGVNVHANLSLSEVDDHPDHLNVLIDAEIIATLYTELASLPEKCQHVCRLLYFDGKKYEEVAKLLNVSVNTVKTQRQRALRLLKNKLLMFFVLFLLF